MKINSNLALAGALLVVGYYLATKSAAAVAKVAQEINPMNYNNSAARTFRSIYGGGFDGKGTLGGDIYELLHGNGSDLIN